MLLLQCIVAALTALTCFTRPTQNTSVGFEGTGMNPTLRNGHFWNAPFFHISLTDLENCIWQFLQRFGNR